MLISGIVVPLLTYGQKTSSNCVLPGMARLAPILNSYAWKVYKVELMAAAIVYSVLSLFPAWVLSSAYARTPGVRKLLDVAQAKRLGSMVSGGVPDLSVDFALLGMGLCVCSVAMRNSSWLA